MKSLKWLKQAAHIYTIALVLILGQITAIPGFAETIATNDFTKAEVASALVPPGFTKEDFKVVEELDTIARENRKRQQDRNNGVAVVEEDISTSKCRTRASKDRERMRDITRYRSLTAAQGYDEICRLRQKLNQQTGGPAVTCTDFGDMSGDSSNVNPTGQLQAKDSKYTLDPGSQVDHVDDEDWERKRKAAEERMRVATAELNRYRALVPGKFAAYDRKRQQCEDFRFGCMSRADREELNRLREEYETAAFGLRQAETEHRAAKSHLDNYGKPLIAERGNMDAASADILKNDEDMKESDAFSGVGTGANGNLSGPVYETNEALRGAIDRYTTNAADFAMEKINEVRDLEFRNENRGEYELYEMSLKDIDGNSVGGRMALSNLDVMAMASSAIKKLKCSPKDDHDSKAYHIYRAASATYVAAIIRDKGADQDYNQCIRDEIYNEEEENDAQFETVEKALNSHTQIVDTMCTMVNPDPDNIPSINGTPILSREQVEKLKQICDASAGVGCTAGQTEGCAPRTRETALEMYNTALMIAQQELADKRQLVMTADANVKKGERKIKATKQKILMSNALFVMNLILKNVYTAIGNALNASICACGAPFLALASNHWSKYVFWLGMNAYYISELIRWQNFTKKWREKLRKAKLHTHLACNYNEAKGAETKHLSFAEETKRKAQEEYDKAKESVEQQLNDANLGALDKKTGYFIKPKGLPEQFEAIAANIYLKKYMAYVGQSALNALFPSALAQDTEVGNNNEEAVDASMADSRLSAKAAGMAVGSTSFYHFIIRQNEHWQDQAFDADGPEGSGTGYAHDELIIMYCGEGGTAGKCIKDGTVGMPTPETRVKLIQAGVTLVQENLTGMLGHLNDAVGQRDKYVMLLNQMRQQMKLGVKGTDTQVEEKPVVKKETCMKKLPNGSYETDKTCQCKQTGNCAKLQYPDFGEFAPGVFADSEAAIKKFSDKNLSGDLEGAKVSAGEINDNANAVRRKIRDNYEDINKAREDKGLKPIDFKKESQRSIAESRKASMEKYAKLFPSSFKNEKTRGGLSSYYNDLNTGAGEGTIKKTPPVLAAVGDSKKATGAVAAKAQGSGDAKGESFDFDFEYDIEDMSPEEIARLKKQQEDAAALAALNAGRTESGDSRYRHKRSTSGDGDSSGINKDTKKNIFGIISSRYKKSAFPILLNDQFIR